MKKTLSCLAILAGSAAFAAGTYHVTKEIKVGGEGGWDYLTMDSAARRLYVSHATKVVVIDADAGTKVGEIPGTTGVHGIAIAPDLNRGFTSNGRIDNVTIFDLKTLKEIGKVATGKNPDAIQYEPVSQRVFTFNGRSNDSTVIDAKTGKVEGTIPLGGKPEFSAADGKGKIYVNIEDKNEVVEIDAKTMGVTKRYSIAPACDEPSGLAMDTKHRRIFSVCGNKVMAISDPDTGKLVATLPIGDGADGVAFDPELGYAFSSNGQSATVTIVHEAGGKWQVLENVPTKRGARTIAVDTKTHTAFTPTAEFGAAPAATAQTPRPRPAMTPDSFEIVVVGQ